MWRGHTKGVKTEGEIFKHGQKTDMEGAAGLPQTALSILCDL